MAERAVAVVRPQQRSAGRRLRRLWQECASLGRSVSAQPGPLRTVPDDVWAQVRLLLTSQQPHAADDPTGPTAPTPRVLTARPRARTGA